MKKTLIGIGILLLMAAIFVIGQQIQRKNAERHFWFDNMPPDRHCVDFFAPEGEIVSVINGNAP